MPRLSLAACAALALACTRPAPPAAAPPSVAFAADTSWVGRSGLYQVFVQDFSPEGTLRGVIAGLDRIAATGADVIWLMPIQPIGVQGRKGTLGSPYAIRDYRAVNPAYGTLADVRALVDSAHARGMRVILDWVPDHTALDHPWVRTHADWYVRDSTGAPSVPIDPSGKATDWTDVVQLDYRNPAVRREMIATMRYWLADVGLDGFRVDVAGFLPLDFWTEAVPALRAAVPRRILLLAEWDDPALHGAGFDLTYGWAGYGVLKAVWKGAPAASFVDSVIADQRRLPAGGMRLRFTTNHDETAWDRPPVTLFGGPAPARAAFVAMALLPGRPLLYNGQEVESPQQLGLFEREAIVWAQPAADSVRAAYAAVMRLARTDASLRAAGLRAVATTAPDAVIAYGRGDVLVLVNARGTAARFEVPGERLAGRRDLLGGGVQAGGTLELPPWGARVLAPAGR